jgi:hypothetical protein
MLRNSKITTTHRSKRNTIKVAKKRMEHGNSDAGVMQQQSSAGLILSLSTSWVETQARTSSSAKGFVSDGVRSQSDL